MKHKKLICTNIANLMRQQRVAKGYSQAELGHLVGEVSKQSISQIERGIANPPLDKVRKFCDLLNISHKKLKKAWIADRKVEIDYEFDNALPLLENDGIEQKS